MLSEARGPLTDEQVVDALDEAFPNWTRAKDRPGKIGIVHRVLYKALEYRRDCELVCLDAGGHRFVMVTGSHDHRRRWWLADSAPVALDVAAEVVDANANSSPETD